MSSTAAGRRLGLACFTALALQILGTTPVHAASHPASNAATHDPRLARAIVRLSLEYHYPAVKLDTGFSRRVISRYIDALDPGHFYFTQKDVKSFHAAFDSHLAKDLRTGNLDPAFEIQKFFLERKKQLYSLARQLLGEKPDLGSAKRYRVEREAAPRAQDDAALEQLWQERIDNDLLDRLLRGESLKSARAALKSRFAHPGSGNATSVFVRYMDAFTHTLDPHSRYITAQEAGSPIDGTEVTQTVAGARLINRNGYVTVVRQATAGDARENDGLVNGSHVLAISPKPGGRTIYLSGWNLDKAIDIIRQSAGTQARLLVELPGPPGLQRTKWLSLPASARQPQTQRARAYIDLARIGTFQYKIGVIRIPSFYRAHGSGVSTQSPRGVGADVAYLIRLLKHKGVSALLLDMRDNTGGSLKEALSLTSLFLPADDPVADIRTRLGNSRHFPLNRHGGIAWRGPLGILVNRGSASATELFCGAMKSYGRAILLGTQTWGKGTIQTFIPLPRQGQAKNPGELKLTTAEFFMPGGNSPQARGVLPDIQLPSASNAFLSGEAAYPDALPQNAIPPYRVAPWDKSLAKAIPILQAYYDRTLAQDRDVKLYRRSISLLKKAATPYVSLNLNTRKQLLETSSAQWLKLENAWRSALGEPQLGQLKEARRKEFEFPDVPLSVTIRIMGKFANMEPSIGFETKSLDLPPRKLQCRYLPLLQVHRLSLCAPGSRQLYFAPPTQSAGKAGKPAYQPTNSGKL